MKIAEVVMEEQLTGRNEARFARKLKRDNRDFQAGWDAALEWVLS